MKKNLTAIGFLGGQFGDLTMGVVAAKAFKTYYPDSKLIIGISHKYMDIWPIFAKNKYFDGIHFWEGYDTTWPTKKDQDYIKLSNFNVIFDPMAKHTNEKWYLKDHQITELQKMHSLKPLDDLQIELEKYFELEDNKKCIAICGGGATRGNEKSLNKEKYNEIIDLVQKLGYIPVQLGLNEDEQICSQRFDGKFFDKIRFFLGCKAIITVDTSYSWIASGYKFPTLGLYNYSYYIGSKSSVNWQPKNPNAIYLEDEKNINNISIEQIELELKNLLKYVKKYF